MREEVGMKDFVNNARLLEAVHTCRSRVGLIAAAIQNALRKPTAEGIRRRKLEKGR